MNCQNLFLRLEAHHIPCLREEPMSRHTTFQVGGPAQLFIQPRSPQEAKQAILDCGEEKIPWFPLGRGSNLLVGDEGMEGAVLHLGALSGIALEGEDTVTAQGGASLMEVCRFAMEHGLAGLEFAYGIPGAVGGGVFMNAGAYGGEMKDVTASADFVEENGEEGRLTGEELGFAYRHSAFSQGHRLILSAKFHLTPGNREEIKARMEELYSRRREKQPLEYPSAGSTFKRPQEGYAAALIDQCGLKGRRIGGAMVSEKHAGFVVNAGGATCADITALMDEVRRVVQEQKSILLEPEIRRVGR